LDVLGYEFVDIMIFDLFAICGLVGWILRYISVMIFFDKGLIFGIIKSKFIKIVR